MLSFIYVYVFSERDTLDRDVMELKKNNTLLDAALKSKSDNLLEVQKEVCYLVPTTLGIPPSLLPPPAPFLLGSHPLPPPLVGCQILKLSKPS